MSPNDLKRIPLQQLNTIHSLLGDYLTLYNRFANKVTFYSDNTPEIEIKHPAITAFIDALKKGLHDLGAKNLEQPTLKPNMHTVQSIIQGYILLRRTENGFLTAEYSSLDNKILMVTTYAADKKVACFELPSGIYQGHGL